MSSALIFFLLLEIFSAGVSTETLPLCKLCDGKDDVLCITDGVKYLELVGNSVSISIQDPKDEPCRVEVSFHGLDRSTSRSGIPEKPVSVPIEQNVRENDSGLGWGLNKMFLTTYKLSLDGLKATGTDPARSFNLRLNK